MPQLMPYELSDDKLLEQCEWDAHRGSGPGGQKRNKTSNAIRIIHVPTGIAAVAEESRSQSENRVHAMRRLKQKLAMELRREIDVLSFQLPGWVGDYKVAGFRMADRNPLYPCLLGLVLDVLASAHWEIARSAATIGITTSALVRFLHDDPHVWQRVNETRRHLGMKPLTWDK